jgi:tight adherence protein C
MILLERFVTFTPWVPSIVLGIRTSLILIAFGLVAWKLYRSHGYLYQIQDKEKTLTNWIEFIEPKVSKLKLEKYRAYLNLHLGRAGFAGKITDNQFLSTQILYGAGAGLFSFFFLPLSAGVSIAFPIFIAATFAIFPLFKVQETSQKRLNSCNRDLGFFLDYMSLAISSGMDFNRSIQTVVDNAPDSALREEFEHVQRSMQLGMQRHEALQDFENRMQSSEVKVFVQNLTQSLKLGTSVADTLQTLSKSLNTRRFQWAEEEAGKISVRMMLPMLCFILPTILLMLVGPMMLTFINN